MPATFPESLLLLFVLLNPFLMSIYLLDLIEALDGRMFRSVLVRGTLIAGTVFVLFAWAGDAVFSRVLQVRFSSFLIFGGVVFLIVAVRYVMLGTEAVRDLRGSPEHLAGSIAMPFMIGPATVSASILAGSRMPFLWAALAVVAALTLTVLGVLALKLLHDYVKSSNEPLVNRYIDVVGRVSAFIIGTIAIEMILNGVDLWLNPAAT